MKFKEPLPASCPPTNVNVPTTETLWRILKGTTPTSEDFESHAAREPRKNYRDACQARAVSLATSLDVCRTIVKLPYPNVRGLTHAAEVTYEPSAGAWDHNHTDHVSYWVAADADPIALTGTVEAL
jgi:hypothetical protein